MSATAARAAFVATVLGYVGTPYHHQGRVPGVGLDCPGPLVCASWEHGIKPRTFNVAGYGRVPDGAVLQGLCEEHMQRIHYDDRLPGDVPLVRFQQGHPQHLGILVDIQSDRQYWVEAEGFRHKRVIKARFMLGDRAVQLVGLYRVPGLGLAA
jgi:cell wall-associated NlpC family hydrolase